jgi:hypothetical protein
LEIRKRTDLLIHNDTANNFLRIEVKAKQKHEWTVEDWIKLVNNHINETKKRFGIGGYINDHNVAVWTTQLKNGKPCEGTGVTVPVIEKHREYWDKIVKAIRDDPGGRGLLQSN